MTPLRVLVLILIPLLSSYSHTQQTLSVISLVSLALLCCHSSQASSTNLSPRFEPTHHAPASLIPNGITSHAALSWIQHRQLYCVLTYISSVVLSTSWGHAGFS
jgi:hypothetical protein